MNELEVGNSVLKSIRHIDENGCEFWYAKELMKVLSYMNLNGIMSMIKKNIESDLNNNFDARIRIMTIEKRDSYKLYYLEIQKSISKKELIFLGKTCSIKPRILTKKTNII